MRYVLERVSLVLKLLHMNSKICIQISKNYKNSAANSQNRELSVLERDVTHHSER